MKLVAYNNPKKHAMHIGNKTIMPGDTREVEETLHPDYKPPVAAEAVPEQSLVEQLIGATAGDAINALPSLDNDQLADLNLLNDAKKKPWKSLTTEIAKHQLERAQASDLETSLDSFDEKLAVADDAMLSELAELHKDDDKLLSLINAEIAKRDTGETPK